LWRIAYDALFNAIESLAVGYRMTTVQALEPMVSDLAFVGGTNFMAPGHIELTRMTDLGTEFFGTHGIEINGKKTELLAINPTHIDNIDYGGRLIQPQVVNKASRVLGVWLAADGSAKATVAMAINVTETTGRILQRK
jgi:hypothetical protein